MAEEFTVVWDVKPETTYNAVASGTKKKKGEALDTLEPVAGKGSAGKVFAAKVCNVSAETAAEAIEVAEELYASKGGTSAAAKVANLVFESK